MLMLGLYSCFCHATTTVSILGYDDGLPPVVCTATEVKEQPVIAESNTSEFCHQFPLMSNNIKLSQHNSYIQLN
jgi:hypothetical protein